MQLGLHPHLFADVDPDTLERVADLWDWNVPLGARPVALSAFCDLLLMDGRGAVLRVDVLDAAVTELAPSRTALLDRLATPEGRDDCMLEGWILRLRAEGHVLSPGECYAFDAPPVLGTQLAIDHLRIRPVRGYAAFTAGLHRALAGVPAGASVHGVEVDAEGQVVVRWSNAARD